MTNVSNLKEQGDGAAEVGGAEQADGRSARRQRNIDAVLDVVLDMFAEEAMFPTIEQAATRSGLSVRSLYRYFSDPGVLVEAAIARATAIGREESRLSAVGQGPLDKRIDDFVTMRLRLYEKLGLVFRASVANAARHDRVRSQLAHDRYELRKQFELQFARELAGCAAQDSAVVELLTQLDSIDFLRSHRGLSVTETHAAITTALRSLLS